MKPSAPDPIAADAVRLHALYGGKVQTAPKCPIRGSGDFVYWYTPGVAAASRAIHADPRRVWELTNRSNLVAVISDGTRVLGLGNIGPEAALPVMEGKALLFKYLGGVDAVALCLATQDQEEIVQTVLRLEPAFGGINLEDISSPKCFRVLDELRHRMTIPVWHDDQQGTATAVLAGLIGALKATGKQAWAIRIALVGAGAANIATFRLLVAYGIDPGQMIACDRGGTLHRNRSDIAAQPVELAEKWHLCTVTNPQRVEGGIEQALRGADVCISFAAPEPGLIKPEWIRAMARDPIVFACANPAPEIWPPDALEAGARIVATGRSDFPNQVNNSLVFPGIFRGTLDSRAVSISDGMAMAAARELAQCAEDRGLSAASILPRMDDLEVVARVAAAAAMEAQESGLARVTHSREEYREMASARIRDSRRMLKALSQEGLLSDQFTPQAR